MAPVGLHPSSRTVSLESADQLREMAAVGGGGAELPFTEQDMAKQLEDRSSILRADLQLHPSPSVLRKESADLNELLNLNASIYDLTVQYSCMAVHRCGGSVGIPSLLTVLVLEVLNVYAQMSILLEVNQLIADPAKAHAQHLYHLFSEHCYGDASSDFIYSQEVESNFDHWDDNVTKNEICRLPLTAPGFFRLILMIWTFYLMHELKQTLYFWWNTLMLERPSEGKVVFLAHEGNFIITHMGCSLKLWLSIIVFVPKLTIAIVLWFIGAGWLTATAGIDNLVLNSLALTFICEVDELIFRTCISEVAKSCLEKTKLPLPPFKYTPTVWVPIETLGTCIVCVALSCLYMNYLQDAIPDYRWDLTNVCRGKMTMAMPTHALGGVM